MQTITLRCDDSVARHIYALLSNTKGVKIDKARKVETKKVLAGVCRLWKDRDVTLNALRDKAWKIIRYKYPH